MTKLLRKKEWKEHRISILNERFDAEKEQNFEITYKLLKRDMISIDAKVIRERIVISNRVNLFKGRHICTIDELELLEMQFLKVNFGVLWAIHNIKKKKYIVD